MNKKITKERLIKLGTTISLLNAIIHDKCNLTVIDDVELTNHIKTLQARILYFEKATGLKLNVNIQEDKNEISM